MRRLRWSSFVLLTAWIAVFVASPALAADTKLSANATGASDTESLPLVVTPTRLLYLGPGAALVNTTVTLHAKLEDAAHAGVAARIVLFRLGAQFCTGVSDLNGNVSCPIPLALPIGPKALQLFFDGDATYRYSTLFTKIVAIQP